MQLALMLCDMKKKFLYEALPDLFPQGRLTNLEIRLWSKYYEQQKDRNG